MSKIINSIDYDYINVKQNIRLLLEKYPALQYGIIGRSCVGRDIPMLKIGRARDYALFAAAFHGSERITCNLLLRFTEELCEALETDGEFSGLNARRALNGRGLIIVPLVNPDGCEIALQGPSGSGYLENAVRDIGGTNFEKWNANARGVDINHNFSAGWNELKKAELENGITGPAMTRFGGYAPESEPETKALTELCRANRIRHVLAFHSQGEVIYWSYGDKEPPKAKKMAQIMATSSGYALDAPMGLAVGGGFKDWFISEFNRPGFTVEVGYGRNPLPPSDLDKIYPRLKEMMILSAIM